MEIARSFNAWFIRLGEDAILSDFIVTIKYDPKLCQGVEEGDGFVIADESSNIIAVTRVYRKRFTLNDITFYFDGIIRLDPTKTLSELNIPNPTTDAAITRLDWSVFKNIIKTVSVSDFASFPVLDGSTAKEQEYIRELLQHAVVDDLLGPANGPLEEIVGMSVRDRYLVGKLAPMSSSEEESIEGLNGSNVIEEGSAEDLHPHEGHHHPGEEFASTEGGLDPDDDTSQEVDASKNQSLVPSSMGFTFCVDTSVENVELQVSWGRYERGESEKVDEKTGKAKRAWKRIPSGGTTTISLKRRTIAPVAVDPHCPEVIVQGTVSATLENDDRLVTLFLVSTQLKPDQNQDQAWVFQPEMVVRDAEGIPIFRRRPLFDTNDHDDERMSLEMIYRKQVEFTVGHGVSVHATTARGDPEHAVEIRTVVLPQYEIPITETPGSIAEDRPALRRLIDEGYLDMKRLAELDRSELVAGLKILTDDYEAWIKERRQKISENVKGYDNVANSAMDRCQEIFERLKEGLKVLDSDDQALEAFRFANHAMASQRIRSVYSLLKRRGEDIDIETLDIPSNRSWRPFQLAFVLLSIPSLADPTHEDRTKPIEAYADLLWFPTGGGKTEAYLGVAAFTMGIRRLQGQLGGLDASRGLAVIMRYTLRLLTIQQFQRATTLICAMEVLRRENIQKWGTEPFTIGLWVGQRVTPNTTEESHKAIQAFRDGQRWRASTPAQFTICPWCGSEIAEGRDIQVKRFTQDIGKTIIYCGDIHSRCEFSRTNSKDMGLPVSVVDEELYRRPPTMMIATVDKFAMMSWKGQVRTLFGKATRKCERHGLLWPEAKCTGNHNAKGNLSRVRVKDITPLRPPDLIIQDEFHLISGPLGTMVGLYETAVDELSTWQIDGEAIKPKIIASTATVRKADEQVNKVFLRKVAVFPPHGLDVEDNFFSVQRSIEDRPGRRYLGICSPGSSRPAVLIRVYVALLTAAQSLFDKFGQGADPYMTVVGYFNSLRELGGMRRLAEDDVQTRAYRVQMSDVTRSGLSQRSVRNVDELTSRVSSKDIPRKLDQLEVKYKANWERGETRSIDIVLATNMLSVGVDVNRLGLMVVNGQPKNTAEYIQATSRVGRFFPGLVCTVLTWTRPRDLSHYETFEHYHATFYKHVEAQSVTPFAPRALDRGLTGAMVSLLRLNHDELNPNQGAEKLNDTTKPEISPVKRAISDRAWNVKDKTAKQSSEAMIADRVDIWVKEANMSGRSLGYETERRRGDMVALLKKPSVTAWDKFTVPLSMREVEPGVQLIMDVSRLPDPPEWRIKSKKKDEGGEA
ncbi:MAG: helicase [Planctomycetes bacterium]|nr:helicase [Planctomycetota bacterium]